KNNSPPSSQALSALCVPTPPDSSSSNFIQPLLRSKLLSVSARNWLSPNGAMSSRISQPFSERRYSRPELLGVSCFTCSNSLVSPSYGSKRFRPRSAVNPFDLRGPEFLAFYLLLSASVLLVLLFLRQRDERNDLPPPQMDDPYLIAFLRGGE